MSRTFLAKFLSSAGQVDVAQDGMEALDLFMDSMKANEPYDLFCLDIMMPKVDGLKVLKVVRAMEEQQGIPPEKHLPIIMMTAIAESDYVDRAFEIGCDAYASKPVELDQLEEVIKSLGFDVEL